MDKYGIPNCATTGGEHVPRLFSIAGYSLVNNGNVNFRKLLASSEGTSENLSRCVNKACPRVSKTSAMHQAARYLITACFCSGLRISQREAFARSYFINAHLTSNFVLKYPRSAGGEYIRLVYLCALSSLCTCGVVENISATCRMHFASFFKFRNSRAILSPSRILTKKAPGKAEKQFMSTTRFSLYFLSSPLSPFFCFLEWSR